MPCSVPSNNERCVARTFAGQRFFLHRETVVLARDHDAPGIELDDGVIRAVVAELHLRPSSRRSRDRGADGPRQMPNVGTPMSTIVLIASIA